MKIYRFLLIGLLTLAILICPLTIFGDGVEVNPAYITGKITLPGYNFSDVVSSAYVYANATGNFSASVQVQKDGTYTLTVNTPADGSKRDYTVYARVDLKSGCEFGPGLPVTVSTVRGGTYTQSFSQELATLEVDGAFTNDDWTTLSPYYQSSTSQYLYFYMNVYKGQTHSFLIPANILFHWTWGYAYPKNTDKYTQLTLDKKEFTASPGETVKLYWTGTFPDKPVTPVGAVSGSIAYSPLPEGTLTGHYFYVSPVSTSIKTDGTYRLANVYAGTSRYFDVSSSFNNGRQSLSWPHSYINPENPNSDYITVPVNGETVINLSASPCIVKGRITLTGSKTLADTSSSVYANAYGVYNTSTYGGSASDSGVNKNTGEYTLYLTPGLWDVSASRGNYIYFSSNSSNPADYLYSYFNYYDYTHSSNFNNGLTVSAGQTVEGYDIEIPTGMVTIKYSSSDGALVSSPYISGSMNEVVDGKTARYCNVYANGSSQAVPEAQATLVAPPGTYTLNTQAVVNGSTVTFSPKSVIVIEGVHTVIEINGPTLNLESPIAELYTYDQQVTVKGTATDDAGVKSVAVNGQSVTIESTGNINDPHEVKFETTLPLVNGPNKIEVVATDTSNKIACDTRYVYRDSGKPTLTVTPANGTVTEDTVITLTGTATDDNEITKLTVNGLSVDFHSTNNPNDPHEVSFSKSYTLAKGPNRFTVTATDNCKRSTTVVNVITNADADIIPPVFGPIQDVTLELTAPEGTAYTLTKPLVTDNIDPAPKVTSDAPAVFPMGKTKVTWTATDTMGNSATAIQYVTVVDTTKPVLTVPASLTVEATGTKTPVNIGQATASDIAAVTVTSNAPADGLYALGTATITWTATDASGNTTTGTQTVTVVDTAGPSLSLPADITVEATAIKTPVEIGQATADDIFGATVRSNAPSDGLYALGATTVTWTATDANGNTTSGAQKITVTDKTPPTLSVPGDVTVEATGIKTPVEIGQATTTDIFPASVSSNAPADGQYALGTTTVTWTATDANGNVTTKTQKVTVVDTTKPSITVPADITIEATGIKTPVEIGQATADDIFGASVSSNAPADGEYALGATTITWTATDANGNVTTGTQKVTVVDTTKPSITVPADITIEATGIKTPVEIGQATGSDIFAVTMSSNAPTDGQYALGTSTVTWTATDANGNATTGTQTITVVDTTKPSLNIPANIKVEATGIKTKVDIGQATADDIFGATVSSNAPADGQYALGATTVTWTATDANGNVTTGTQTITVVDTTKPALNIPANIKVEATGIKTPVNIGQATADDIFGATVSSNAPVDGQYTLGTTTVTWTATDANGNVTTGTQTITVVDTTKPSLNIPANIKVEATGIKTKVDIGQATADDIFGATVSSNAPADGQYALGATTVTWTATDANGNVTTGTQTITVVDTTKPALNIPANIKVEATGIKTKVDFGQATATDIFEVTIRNNAPTDGMFSLGTTTVTWTATDANGNVTTGTQTITVVDTTKPTLNVPADIIVKSTGIKTFVAIGQATASDIFNVTITNNAPADSMYKLGTTIVTWTATDANGNKTTGTQRITVVGPLSCNGLIIHGPLTADQIYSNGSVQINGGCRANLISSTSFVTITGQNQVGTILRNQPSMPLPKPDWQRLSTITNLRTETMLNQPNLINCRFEKSVMFNGSAALSGIIVVKGDLTINGDTRLNNAAIFCTGKITFNGSLRGVGLIYAGSGVVNHGDTQLSGSLITGGVWEVSGVTEIRDYNIQDYLKYFIY